MKKMYFSLKKKTDMRKILTLGQNQKYVFTFAVFCYLKSFKGLYFVTMIVSGRLYPINAIEFLPGL